MALGSTFLTGGDLSILCYSGLSRAVLVGGLIVLAFFYSTFVFGECTFCILLIPAVRLVGLNELRMLLCGLSICESFLDSIIVEIILYSVNWGYHSTGLFRSNSILGKYYFTSKPYYSIAMSQSLKCNTHSRSLEHVDSMSVVSKW